MHTSKVLLIIFCAAIALLFVQPSFAQSETVPDHSNSPIQTWTAVFVDAETNDPLPGIQVDASVSIRGETEQQRRLLVSNDRGAIKIPLRKDQCTSVNIRGPGWCKGSGIYFIGELPANFFDEAPPKSDPEKPITIQLHEGTEVRGRLLLPGGEPAAGMSLRVGVHCGGSPWVSKAYNENRMRVSYSTSDWPNWNSATTTADDGSFSVTVPPANARSWIRLGTTSGGHGVMDTTALEKSNKNHPLVRFAPFSIDINGDTTTRRVDESSGIAELGDLQLAQGIIFRGRVVDALGEPLSGVHLMTSSKHGPHAGRKTVSLTDGSFEFMPMNAGTFRLKPDAYLRDERGKKISRDVQAVFVTQLVALSEDNNPLELVIQALPHVDLEFEWIDRRAVKGPVAYYGSFKLTGYLSQADGTKTWWRGETVKVASEGKEWLVVKVPESIVDLKINLHPDQRVTPSYRDHNTKRATGQILLGDWKQPMWRVIYGDEPR